MERLVAVALMVAAMERLVAVALMVAAQLVVAVAGAMELVVMPVVGGAGNVWVWMEMARDKGPMVLTVGEKASAEAWEAMEGKKVEVVTAATWVRVEGVPMDMVVEAVPVTEGTRMGVAVVTAVATEVTRVVGLMERSRLVATAAERV
jgi:hypothetical protein